jgi:hypothetical protein
MFKAGIAKIINWDVLKIKKIGSAFKLIKRYLLAIILYLNAAFNK